MSALWGTGGRRGDGARSNALRPGRGRSIVVGLVAATVLALPLTAAASTGGSGQPSAGTPVYVPGDLLGQARSSSDATFGVIVQGTGSGDAGTVANEVAEVAADPDGHLAAAATKAERALIRAKSPADAAASKDSAAQQALVKALADAAAKAQRAAQTGTSSDRDAAAKAAQKASDAAKAAADADRAASAAQTALTQAADAAAAAHAALSQATDRALHEQVTGRFSSIDGVSASLTGDQLVALASHGDGILSVTPDAPVAASGEAHWSSSQLWPFASASANTWGRDNDPRFASDVPTIAVVDSGIQGRSDFGDRLLGSVDLSTLPSNSPGDGRGHGTFVAGIAAGGASGITGANPAAKLVDVDVLDDSGMGLTSDIIRACQWILDHKDAYDIRVANFSLNSSITAPFYLDPLDRAVEQLWFSGIVVVAAAGNYGSAGGPSGILYSPADDPFVITVGAVDVNGSKDPKYATLAPWSAWGSTIDGFAKPDVSAPGRYMVGPVPTESTLVSERPGDVTAPGYMELSGTSFAAPVVAGAAANVLAQNPGFTPDQVKGALMATAKGLDDAGGSGGVGVIQAKQAMDQKNPPNPNAVLDAFVKGGTDGASSGLAFDSASWNSASWNSASWNSASWNSASWNSASWNSASWNSAANEDAAAGDVTADTSAFATSPDDFVTLLSQASGRDHGPKGPVGP